MKPEKHNELRALDRNDAASCAAHTPDHLEGAYRFRVISVAQAIDKAVTGQWDVPEFQRQFIWRPAQVCALADSLWRNYPIGPLLLWQSKTTSGNEPPFWIADGQQRLTSLCLLYGAMPAWFRRKPAEFRARVQRRFDIRFDVSAHDGPRFVAAPPRRADDPCLIPTGRLMALDAGIRGGGTELERMVRALGDAGVCRALDEAEIYRRLARVSMIRQCEMTVTIVDHPRRDDVLDIFARLNSRGMRFRRLLLKLAMEEIPAAIRGMRGLYQR